MYEHSNQDPVSILNWSGDPTRFLKQNSRLSFCDWKELYNALFDFAEKHRIPYYFALHFIDYQIERNWLMRDGAPVTKPIEIFKRWSRSKFDYIKNAPCFSGYVSITKPLYFSLLRFATDYCITYELTGEPPTNNAFIIFADSSEEKRDYAYNLIIKVLHDVKKIKKNKITDDKSIEKLRYMQHGLKSDWGRK